MTSVDAYALNDHDSSFEDIMIAINLYQEDWKIAEIGKRIYVNPSARFARKSDHSGSWSLSSSNSKSLL